MKLIQATTIAFLVLDALGGDLVTPRGKRRPFIRFKSVSWETLNQHTLDGKKR